MLVYAQDGLTRDDEVRGRGADNLTFAENALRWLDADGVPEGCAAGTTIVFWPGTFLRPSQIDRRAPLRRSPRLALRRDRPGGSRRGPALRVGAVVRQRLGSAGRLRHRGTCRASSGSCASGGGLLVGGLGWSYAQQGPDAPYAADQLGEPFGFRFSLNAFQANPRQPIPLLVP